MRLFDRPLHIPAIEALPAVLFPLAAKAGEVAVGEQSFPHGLQLADPVEHGWRREAKVIPFPMGEVVQLEIPDNIELGGE